MSNISGTFGLLDKSVKIPHKAKKDISARSPKPSLSRIRANLTPNNSPKAISMSFNSNKEDSNKDVSLDMNISMN